MDQFLLLGDSLTERSFSPHLTFSLGAALTHAYARKLDLLNRGLSGYNTTQALRVLPHCLPSPHSSPGAPATSAGGTLRLLTIWFGANDARLPSTPGGPDQSVELAQFRRNLKAMATHAAVRAHEGVRVVLITPPPIDERMCGRSDAEKYPELAGRGVRRRSAAHTAAYARAVREVGVETGTPVVDVWTAVMVRCGYAGGGAGMSAQDGEVVVGSLEAPTNEMLQGFLVDGLHLSGEGYKVVFGELMGLIGREWPEMMPSQLGMRLPAWDDARAWRE